MSNQNAVPTGRKGWSLTTKLLVIWGVVSVVAIAAFGVIYLRGGFAPGPETQAKDVCEQFVTDQLKAPATAVFSGAFAAEQSDASWIVRGSVDSENGFGAMIRNNYTCRVRPAGGDEWTLDKLTTTGK